MTTITKAVNEYLQYIQRMDVTVGHLEHEAWALERLTSFTGLIDIDSLDRADLKRAYNTVKGRSGRKYSQRTKDNLANAWARFFEWAVTRTLIVENIANKLPRNTYLAPEKGKGADPAHFALVKSKLHEYAYHRGGEPIDIRNALIVSLSMDSAARLVSLWSAELKVMQEALKHPEYVRHPRGKSTVYHWRSRGKGHANRIVRLIFLESSAELLRSYLSVRPMTDSKYLFVSHQARNYGGQLDKYNISTAFRKLCDYCKVPRFLSHAVRHRLITDMVLAGVDPKTVQEFACHKKVTTTLEVYTHVSRSRVAANAAYISQKYNA